MKSFYYLIFLIILVFQGCVKDILKSYPYATVQGLIFDQESCMLNVTGLLSGYLEGDYPLVYGFVYSYDNQEPTIIEEKVIVSDDYQNDTDFTVTLSNLEIGETIYLRIFAQRENNVFYGEEIKRYGHHVKSSDFVHYVPDLIRCGSIDMEVEVPIVSCYPKGFSYGIIYSNGIAQSQRIVIEKGITDGNYPVRITSNLVEESQGMTAYSFYIQDLLSDFYLQSDDYMIPNAPTSPKTKRVADFPGELRGEAVSFTLNGRGYVCGGYTEGREMFLEDLWEYNPSSNTWVERASYPGGRRALMTSFTSDGYAYVGTGSIEVNQNEILYSEFYRYDPINDKWTAIAKFPFAGHAGLSFTLENSGYVGGMLTEDGANNQRFFRYEAVEDRWVEVASFPRSFFNARNSAIANDKKGYVLLSLPNKTSYYGYDPRQDAWTKEFIEVLFDGNDGLAFTKNNKLYQLTGRKTNVGIELDFETSTAKVLCVDRAIGRSEAVGFDLNGAFYVATGIASNYNTSLALDPLETVFRIDFE